MRLLIVGPLGGHITTAAKIALETGARVLQADTVLEAMKTVRAGKGVDLIMADVTVDIGAMIAALEVERISLPVVACGIGTDAQAAVRAIRAGAREYVPLPPNAELIAAILTAVAQESHALIARDPSMQAVLRLAEQVAPAEASVLITGESGTGKEVMARHIHEKSKRTGKCFVAVNCAAIPENLLESELFGHEKGAFTGAVARRIGKFEEADGGTLLLDEISEMDMRLQAKLLRAIQEREIDRVGGIKPVKVNIRLLATSNRDLEAHVRAGQFREDLYFRLNVVNIKMPPLRDRPLDIAVLAEHFAQKFCELNGLEPKKISDEAMGMLQGHVWRGNVRELENTLHRAVLMSTGETIGSAHILLTGHGLADPAQANPAPSLASTATAVAAGGRVAAPVRAPDTAALVGKTVADVERDLILNTLTHTLGNRTHAANILGISIRTLRNKLKLYGEQGVPVPPPREGERAMAD